MEPQILFPGITCKVTVITPVSLAMSDAKHTPKVGSDVPSDVSPLQNSLTLNYWADRWKDSNTGWHESTGNKMMWKHFSSVLAEKFPSKKPGDLKVFVPLCGKAKDMYLLYEMGFTVVGIEFAKQPIDEFFTENKLEEKEWNAPFRSTKDGRLIIGQGDLFSFSKVAESATMSSSADNHHDQSAPKPLPYEKYDIIWDRGSFEAINEKDRGRYVAMMMSLLTGDGFYLLNTKDYSLSEYGGPPLAANTDDLKQLFHNHEVALLDKEDIIDSDEKWRKKGLTKLYELLHIITFKN